MWLTKIAKMLQWLGKREQQVNVLEKNLSDSIVKNISHKGYLRRKCLMSDYPSFCPNPEPGTVEMPVASKSRRQ